MMLVRLTSPAEKLQETYDLPRREANAMTANVYVQVLDHTTFAGNMDQTPAEKR